MAPAFSFIWYQAWHYDPQRIIVLEPTGQARRQIPDLEGTEILMCYQGLKPIPVCQSQYSGFLLKVFDIAYWQINPIFQWLSGCLRCQFIDKNEICLDHAGR